MGWYSWYGTGVMLYGVRPQGDGRARVTSWLTVLWLPVLPIRTWNAAYLGSRGPNGLTDESLVFGDLKQVPHDWNSISKTFAAGMLGLIVTVVPIVGLIFRTNGRAATTVEMVLLLGAAVWTVAFILWVEWRRKKKLEGS